MPVYEYECPACEKVIEVQQRMSDDPLSQCPDCGGPVKKIMSMSSFKLKGGGWYADGYASTQPAGKSTSTSSTAAPPCKSSGSCPCAAANS
ncbi:putative regulatory protein, FmdB family [Desulfocapsa sulfexigens DSM 10523]|uniref:Putative regulatory protein, FmdB family n=1 Tax=Desulfocapsa sulfexigens (strain DSM 10523 / SB164P1) TaxID=1167006 RepID=M1PGA0_DESSD|nr:zinc ribbon domain-containing protein [Desulfocapsa sulfexigens]AGF78685.1 putative regulatory protein, FmdB family [Desulfocapsa sulfexigens DSM 10523]